MTMRLLALAGILLWPVGAGAQLAVSSNDNKAVLVDGVNTVPADPQPDTVTVVDLGVSPPRVVAELNAPGGWSAPPQSVAVAPDESIALVASSAKLDPANPARTVFNDELTVIDLRASPPRVVSTLRTGRRAAGVSINPAGTLALVANRAEGTLSVFTISGTTVTPAGTVDFGAPESEPSLPVFSPDGRTVYVTRNNDHRISILSVDGTTVSYTKRDISANLRPYSMEITPRGDYAVVGNIGNGPTGGADTISVIDLAAAPPRLVDAVTVGLIPEGVALSPDGRFVAAAVMNGSNLGKASPHFNDFGLLKIYRLTGGRLTLVTEARSGHWCQGLAWNRTGDTVVIQCAVERELQVFRFDGRRLTRSGAVKVNGAPTGIRTATPRPPAAPATLSGTLRMGEPGQTPYTVMVPAAWNGTLVLDLDFTTGWRPAQRQWFLDHGYAIGGTRRTQNESAYRIRDYVDNFLTLRIRVAERFGPVRRTIAFGVSRGAIPARAAIELHPEIFDGAVVFSGGGQALVGLLNTKLDSVWALKTLVDPQSPLTLVNLPLPPLPANDRAFTDLVSRAASSPLGRARLALAAAFEQPPTWSIVGSSRPARDDYDAQLDQIIDGFGGFQGVRAQIETLAGGNPSWNHGVDYGDLLGRSGLRGLVEAQYRKAGASLDADLAALAQAPRIAAEPAAVAVAERHVGYTGKIKAPILSVKTVGDPADSPSTDTAYTQTLRRAGTARLLRNVYIDRPGHATMTVVERVVAFQALVDRLDTGRWEDEGRLPARFNADAVRIAEATSLDLGTAAFVAFTPAPALRTWDFTNWGTYRNPR